ncbi:MAG: hypothetical protein HYZ53_10715 [Planctomycetes bacterium]|nr:hypothetical protein [Planctomycetota bacterium]
MQPSGPSPAARHNTQNLILVITVSPTPTIPEGGGMLSLPRISAGIGEYLRLPDVGTLGTLLTAGGELYCWIYKRTEPGNACAFLRVVAADGSGKVGEIGLGFINEELEQQDQDGAFQREMWPGALHLLFQELGFDELQTGIFKTNDQLIELMKDLGFKASWRESQIEVDQKSLNLQVLQQAGLGDRFVERDGKIFVRLAELKMTKEQFQKKYAAG